MTDPDRAVVAVCQLGGVVTNRDEARAAAEPIHGPAAALVAGLSGQYSCVVVGGLAEAGADLAAARDRRLGPYNDALADRRSELYS